MSRKHKGCRNGSKVPPPSGRRPAAPLTVRDVESMADELLTYHRWMAPSFQRREQRQWSLFYLCGQLSNLERKTSEPMILHLKGPDDNAVRALNQFLGQGTWDAHHLLRRHQMLVGQTLGDPGGVVIVDGSGFPKQGQHSVGVARQYCDALGKVANCQEGVFAVYASPLGSAFVDCRLYLHESWFAEEARARWHQSGIPEEAVFQTEPELALEMLQELVRRGVLPFRWVMADAHFGQNPAFLDGVAALDKWYLAEIPADTRVWLRTPAVEAPGRGPLGRPRTRPRVALRAPRPGEVRQLAAHLPPQAWQRYFIKEGSKGPMVAEFAFLRVTSVRETLPGPRLWLVFRRRRRPQPELKFYFSNAPTSTPPREFAQLSGWRWPVETTLEEGKGEVGMDQYEVRTWAGWYHQMVQSFMAHYFLTQVRVQFKKSPGPDDGASACLDRERPPGRRCALTEDPRRGRVLPTSELFGLLFTSQKDTAPPSSPTRYSSKAQSLEVM
jgi:SRSO17 transposase